MEFNEKLQELRKSRNLTQEELAEALYVSRTAISKWESGRGLPSIESLKEISCYFSVSIDDLLSGEKLITIAENENRRSIKNICDLYLGIADVLYFALIALPVYSNPTGGRIYAVNLFMYVEKASFNHVIYWIMFAAIMAVGTAKALLSHLKISRGQRSLTAVSMALGAAAVLLLALTREAYAICVSFLLMIIKGTLLLKYERK